MSFASRAVSMALSMKPSETFKSRRRKCRILQIVYGLFAMLAIVALGLVAIYMTEFGIPRFIFCGIGMGTILMLVLSAIRDNQKEIRAVDSLFALPNANLWITALGDNSFNRR